MRLEWGCARAASLQSRRKSPQGTRAGSPGRSPGVRVGRTGGVPEGRSGPARPPTCGQRRQRRQLAMRLEWEWGRAACLQGRPKSPQGTRAGSPGRSPGVRVGSTGGVPEGRSGPASRKLERRSSEAEGGRHRRHHSSIVILSERCPAAGPQVIASRRTPIASNSSRSPEGVSVRSLCP